MDRNLIRNFSPGGAHGQTESVLWTKLFSDGSENGSLFIFFLAGCAAVFPAPLLGPAWAFRGADDAVPSDVRNNVTVIALAPAQGAQQIN